MGRDEGPSPSPLAMAGAPKPFWRRLKQVSVQCHRPQSVDCWLTENRILTFRHLVVLHGFTGLPSGNQTYTDTAMGNPHYINGVFLAIFCCVNDGILLEYDILYCL